MAAGGQIADDHFNLKLASNGRLFATVKTSHGGSSSTLVGLFVRSPQGVWSALHKVTNVEFGPPRLICLLNEVSHRVYVFYSLNQSNVYYKDSDLDNRVPGRQRHPLHRQLHGRRDQQPDQHQAAGGSVARAGGARLEPGE